MNDDRMLALSDKEAAQEAARKAIEVLRNYRTDDTG